MISHEFFVPLFPKCRAPACPELRGSIFSARFFHGFSFLTASRKAPRKRRPPRKAAATQEREVHGKPAKPIVRLT